MTEEEETQYQRRLLILQDLLYSTIPVRDGNLIDMKNDSAREFSNNVLKWHIGREKAEELIKNYLKSYGLDYYSKDAIRFIFSSER